MADNSSNYSFSSTLTISSVDVAPSSELSFDWSALSQDFVGHSLDPLADIDMVTLLLWKLTEADLATKLNADDLAQSDLEALVTLYTENLSTDGGLFDFTSFGAEVEQDDLLGYLDIDAFDPATHTYTVMAVTGTTAGEGTRMIQSFRLSADSTNTHVALENDSTGLDFSVDLESLEPVVLPRDEAGVTVDWTDMTVNALGGAFIPTSITEVLVAHYSETPAELEAQFLDLDLIAQDLWRTDVPSGTSLDLSLLSNAAGSNFSGINDEGTWIVALICGSCANPAPWYISRLETCDAN
jgi:hypothetical protein